MRKHFILVAGILSALISGCGKPNSGVSFVFDDAYLSHLEVAKLFEEYGYRAGFAVNGSLVKWSQGGRLTFIQLRELQGRGHEILNHGARHLNLSDDKQPLSNAASEILGGQKVLEAEGLRVTAYAAANSNLAPLFVDRYLRKSHKLGFTQSGDINPGVKRTDPFKLHRANLAVLGVEGAKRRIAESAASGDWVVFYDHDPSKEKYVKSMSFSELRQVLEYCRLHGISVTPPTTAAKRMGLF